MAFIVESRLSSIIAALTTDLGQSLVITEHPGNKYLATQYPGVRYVQEPHICITITSFGEGKDQHIPELTQEIWFSKREWEKVMEQVIKYGKG